MKKIIRLSLLCMLLLPVASLFSQKYKYAADTVKLNEQYLKLLNEKADLNARLAIAQNDLPGYQAKINAANNDAVDAASASSNQASKATNGKVSDARNAKRKASKAYNEAKDLEWAKKRLSKQEDKITRYQLDLKKNQERIADLDIMRVAIFTKISADSVLQIRQ
jgi:DNA repair exonuclease SbcCD ATPase subunit